MRQERVTKVRRPVSTRRRAREEKAEEERPEVREDIRRVWFSEE